MKFHKLFRAGRIPLLMMFVTILTCSSGWAATYYVDPNGNDTSGNGSQTYPWKSLSNACAKVTGSGNTISINPGTYTDNNRCNLAFGVNIQGAGISSTTIITSYNGGVESGYIYRAQSQTNPVPHGNNDISGFTLDGNNKTASGGIWIRGSDTINIHDMKIMNMKIRAIGLGGYGFGTDYATLTMNQPVAYGIGYNLYNLTIDNTTETTTSTTSDRLGAIDLLGVANVTFHDSTINENYANSGTGVKAVPGWLKNFKMYNVTFTMYPSHTDNFVIETYNFTSDSEIYNCTFNHLISLNGGITTLNAGSSWNLKIHDNVFTYGYSGTSGNEFSHNWLDVYNNYFYGYPAPTAGLWSTNYLTGSGVSHWRFRNNVVYNCADGVYLVRGANSYVEIYNNVFDTMNAKPWGGSGIDAAGFSGTLSGAKIQNNLIMNTVSAPISIGSNLTNTLVDHNWFYNDGNSNNISNSGASTTQTNNVKGVLPGINLSGTRPDPYYRPSSATSNVVDAGINVGLPYSGTAPPVGAYEYFSTTPVLNAPTNLKAN